MSDGSSLDLSFRPFRNSDPPRLVELWHAAEMGRGAAAEFGYDALEFSALSLSYFDRAGLIVAEDADGRIVGMIHAGFGPTEDESRLSFETGVICVVSVHPAARRQGVGRELVRQAESYLISRGAERVLAGPAAPFDPFYTGLYGGSRPTGFLESDPNAKPFFESLGYHAAERYQVLQKDLLTTREPVSFKLVSARRRTELVITGGPPEPSWWWQTRYGRFDTLQFVLRNKSGGDSLASVTAVGLDWYLHKWRQRVIGLINLQVDESSRRKGYASTLLTEISKRLREEMVSVIEVHVHEQNHAALRVFESSGFSKIDTGVVYRKDFERG